jgi:hypothetical protein
MATVKKPAVKADGIISPKMQTVMKELYEKFPPEKIKERSGRAGQKWKYIDSAEVLNRLNEVFGYAWSAMEVHSEIVANKFIIKRVRIEVPSLDIPGQTFVKEGWGSHPLTDSRGQMQDPGDCSKSAYSKAFNKAASQLGIGLHLWGIGGDYEGEPDSPYSGDELPAPWEGQNQFQQGPVVNVVNQGPQNPPPPGVASQPMQFAQQPMMGNPQAPVHTAPPQAGPPQQAQGPIPQMVNPGMGTNAGPPVAAQVTFQGNPNPGMAPAAGGAIVDFQVNAIRGAASTLGIHPMQLASQVLGPAIQGLQAIEELTYDQAVQVLEYMRNNMQGRTGQ